VGVRDEGCVPVVGVGGGRGGMRAYEIRPWNPLLFEVSEDFRVFLLTFLDLPSLPT